MVVVEKVTLCPVFHVMLHNVRGTYLRSQARFKVFFHGGNSNSVLRSFGAAAAWNHFTQIQLYNLIERQ